MPPLVPSRLRLALLKIGKEVVAAFGELEAIGRLFGD